MNYNSKNFSNTKYLLLYLILILTIINIHNLSAKPQTSDTILQNIQKLSLAEKIKIYSDLCWDIRGKNPKLALTCGLEAMKLAQNNHFDSSLPRIYNYLGLIYRNIGNYGIAQSYYVKCISKSEETNNLIEYYYANNNIGEIFLLTKDNVEANKYLHKALNGFIKIGNKSGAAYSYHQLAYLNTAMNNYKEALYFNRRALQIRESLKDSFNIAASYRNMGKCYLNLGKLDSALYFFNEHFRFSKQANNLTLLSDSYENFGTFYSTTNNSKTAKLYYEKCLEDACKIRYWKNAKVASLALSKISENENNTAKALYYRKLYQSILDTLNNQTSIRKVYETIDNYNLEKENELLKQIEQKNKWIRNSILIALTVTLILLLIVFFRNKIIINQNKKLEEQKEQIEKQKDELKETNTTKDKFFNIIAHDLKNPIGAILNFSEIFQNEADTLTKEEILYFSGMITEASKNLLNLFTNLLDWSRSQSGKIEYNPELTDMSKVIDSAITSVKYQAGNKEILIEKKIEENINLNIDPNMLVTVFRNLLSNAIKFTNHGGKVVLSNTVSSNKVIYSVIDNGIGMDNDTIEKLFKLNSRTSTTGTSNESGTGLGLLLCKEFVEKNHGKIYVESAPGIGSTFFVEFEKQ